MKIKLRVITILALMMLAITFNASAEGNGYIVKLKDGDVPDGLTQILTEVNSRHRIYSIDNLEKLEGFDEYIEHTEENSEASLIDSVPNIGLLSLPEDEFFSRQWHIQMVNAEFAWDMETYGNNVNVAVIDSGCNQHEDLNVVGGYNFVDDNDDYSDLDGHGTHVAGIISAQHNEIGVAGIAPKVNLYALKCFELGRGDVLGMIDAIYSAVDDYNCKVINMSMGVLGNFKELHDAVKYAVNSGAIVVAAVGNSGMESEPVCSQLWYPASYDEVIGVGSVNINKSRSDYSQRNNFVTVVAPGEYYPSTVETTRYDYKSGTSMATPMVTAAAALLLSADGDMTPAMFKNYIIKCSERLTEEYCGYGLLNIGAMFWEAIRYKYYYVSPINDDGVLIYNNTTGPLGAFGVFAEYEDEVFDYVKLHEILLMSGKKTKINCIDADGTLKFFLWAGNLRPLADARIRGN